MIRCIFANEDARGLSGMKFHRSTANQNLVILRAPSAPPVPRGRPALSNSPRGIAVVPRSSRGCSAVVPRFRGRPGEVRLGRSSYSKIPFFDCRSAYVRQTRGSAENTRKRGIARNRDSRRSNTFGQSGRPGHQISRCIAPQPPMRRTRSWRKNPTFRQRRASSVSAAAGTATSSSDGL